VVQSNHSCVAWLEREQNGRSSVVVYGANSAKDVSDPRGGNDSISYYIRIASRITGMYISNEIYISPRLKFFYPSSGIKTKRKDLYRNSETLIVCRSLALRHH
jgi:hypothetical protein